ncbi:response regulator transcription factor [Fluviispira multicolorata]|nr:response regulator transcription factor [Fluviispira multicolorata]
MSNSKEFLLIVEDEESIGEGLQYNFEAEGFEVALVSDGKDAIQFIKENYDKISTIILDLMLPQIDGYEILKKTRILAERIPILVLSAKSLEVDRIKAFELGADDYVTKPFSLSEIILRVKRLVQRRKWYKPNGKESIQKFGSSLFDPEQLTITTSDGTTHRISPTEGLLVQIFIENENKILARTDLLQKVWQYEATIETRTVDVFVGKLRKYIEKNAAKPIHIISVRGVGYTYVTNSVEKN